ncbi:MAG: alanine--tRNA ligase, partial [Actinobacteria bacterium]|nr:alanine--tRNA ligase [Actinomycetota bacterium]
GGQLSDQGKIEIDGGIFEVSDVQNPLAGVIVHRGVLRKGNLKVGGQARALIDVDRRAAISRAHTATHMVHKAFREVLGETATQAGSENSPGRFRFDFPSTSAVPDSVMNDVEARVNELLISDLPVTAEVMSQKAAKAMGAMALFGEKYGEQVRVVSVGDWAKELCGGTHVNRSGQLGVVKLLSESSIGAGVRRVEALVGVDAYKFLAREHVLLNSLTEIIKGARAEELPERINNLIERMRQIEKELNIVRSKQLLSGLSEMVARAENVKDLKVLVEKISDEVESELLRKLCLELAAKVDVVVLLTISANKPVIMSAVSTSAISKGIKAGDLIKVGSTELGGGGGGKQEFAQGGGAEGSSQAKINSALQLIKSAIVKNLS